MGVLGINGTGKSTLLRVLAGTQVPEAGEVARGRDVRVSMLDQDAPLPAGTVLDAVTATGSEVWEAESVLTRLGMGGFFEKSTSDLSGGEAKRVSLAVALVSPSDLLILDEPTNHLDIDGITWLEQRLEQYRGGLILVTHDRHLLNRLTTVMLELDRGHSHVHTGGYASYLEAKTDREAAAATAEAVRRNLAKSELAWLRRGAPARTSKPKYRMEAAKALISQKAEQAARPAEIHLDFGTPRLGDVVIELEGISAIAPGGHHLFGPLDLKLDPRERLAIRGANGSGKSTLLDIMAKRRAPAAGDVRWGSTVELGYYTQHGDELDPRARAREVVAGPNRQPDWQDARLLEAFWFDKDSQWAEVSTLSGGERRRLQLLKVLAARPNVLLLDEPTNDLDIETLRALEDFLEDWPGAVVVVSHDRAFLHRVANRHLTIGDGRAAEMPVSSLEELPPQDLPSKKGSAKKVVASPAPETKPAAKSGRSASTLGHLIRQAEKEIAKLTDKKATLEQQMADITDNNPSDYSGLADLGQTHTDISTRLDALEEEWLELSDEQETR